MWKWMWVEEETDGPYDDGTVQRDYCYAWTNNNSRCGRAGVGWPMPRFSRVFLCGQHAEAMEPLLKMAISEGLIDLTDTPPPRDHAVPHCLYRYYDADDNPLYIGVTKRPRERERSHSEKAWFTRVARKETEEYPDRYSALEAEREAIVREQPEFNIVHRFSPGAYGEDVA